MLSSRNPHACYLQNLNDDGKLHNGLTASLCSCAAPPQKQINSKEGGKQHSSNKADSTKCSKCDQHKCQRRMSPTALVSAPAFFSVGATLFSNFKRFVLYVEICPLYRRSEWTLNIFDAQYVWWCVLLWFVPLILKRCPLESSKGLYYRGHFTRCMVYSTTSSWII